MSNMTMSRRIVYLCFITFFCVVLGFSESEGVRLFKSNKPLDAIPFLEKEISGGNVDPVLYNYLGIAYYQTGDFEKSVKIFTDGLSVIGTNKKVLYFNCGNSYYALGNYQSAEDSYRMAIIADPEYADPVLNRANARLKLDKLDLAAEDYNNFLTLRPNDVQEPQIKRLLSLLAQEKIRREQEAIRLAEEAEKRKLEDQRLQEAKAEQDRLAQEAALKEAERRRKLLEDVANEIKQNSDSTNISAGAENVLQYDEESDID